MSRPRIATITAIVIGLLVSACGSGANPQTSSGPAGSAVIHAGFEPTQRNEGGEVTVAATWDGPSAGAALDVKLDTHTVDLDALTLADATLTNDRGQRLAATPWQAPTGGHHRQGQLTFGGDAATFLEGARWIELTLNGVGSVPQRVLHWDLPA